MTRIEFLLAPPPGNKWNGALEAMATLSGKSAQTIRRYCSGKDEAPYTVALAMTKYVNEKTGGEWSIEEIFETVNDKGKTIKIKS